MELKACPCVQQPHEDCHWSILMKLVTSPYCYFSMHNWLWPFIYFCNQVTFLIFPANKYKS